MFIITDREPCGPDCSPACSCGRYLEIWNDVFMQYNKNAEGKYEPLAKKNVDTGMGLERTVCVLNGKKSVYEIDAFARIMAKIAELSGKEYEADPETTRAFRIIADHMRTSTFILGDDRGVSPSNTDQGYILRRLIRRAVRYGMQLGMPEGFTVEIAKVIIDQYKDVYPELERNSAFVLEQLKLEEGRFARTLKQGEKEFEKVYQNVCQTRTMLESILAAEDGTALARELAASKKLRPSPDMMPIIEAAKAGMPQRWKRRSGPGWPPPYPRPRSRPRSAGSDCTAGI
jgi:alanyl-tRNA synthetase